MSNPLANPPETALICQFPGHGAPKVLSEARSSLLCMTPVPTSDGMARPAELNPMPDTKASAVEINLETIPSSTPSAGNGAAGRQLAAPAHKETEELRRVDTHVCCGFYAEASGRCCCRGGLGGS